nr:MAG TPA: hypothetical protein [Caudoviricetes sp.]
MAVVVEPQHCAGAFLFVINSDCGIIEVSL